MTQAKKPFLPPLTLEQRTWRRRILVSTYLGYAGFYLTRKVFSICKSTLAKDLGWELSDTGTIFTAFLVAYMLGQFINGLAGRKWGPRVILLTGLGASIACAGIFGAANSYWTFLFFMFVNGLAQGGGWPGVVGGVSMWIRKQERGEIMGVWTTSYMFGNIVVKSLGAFLLAHWGWRWSFWGCGALTVLAWLLLLFWQRDKPEDAGLEPIVKETAADLKAGNRERPPLAEYLRLLGNPVVLAMGASYFCVKFLRYALDSWLPAFFNVLGLPADWASYYTMGFDLAGMGGAILAGYALDRVFRGDWSRVCVLMGSGMVLGYAMILSGGSLEFQALTFAFIGLMLYGPDTLLSGAASVQVAGERNGVAVAGLVNGIASIGPVVQEAVISWFVRDKENLERGIRDVNVMALWMSSAFLAMILAVHWRLHRAEGRRTALAAAEAAIRTAEGRKARKLKPRERRPRR